MTPTPASTPTPSRARTLASLVDDHVAAARILERHRLDYCCGGRATLEDACAEAGVDVETVVAELAALDGLPDPVPWATMSPADVVDHLEATHHSYLREELPRLGALVDKVAGVHGRRHRELARVREAFVALRAELEPHLAKEERVLFPMIRELAAASEVPAFHCGTLANPIRVMLTEHDRAGELLAAMRAASGDYELPGDACGSYRALYLGLEELEADTHLHVHKENDVLFPAVLVLEVQRAGTVRTARPSSPSTGSALRDPAT